MLYFHTNNDSNLSKRIFVTQIDNGHDSAGNGINVWKIGI